MNVFNQIKKMFHKSINVVRQLYFDTIYEWLKNLL